MDRTVDQSTIDSEREYLEFLDETEEYKDRINSLITRDSIRLIININDLRRENPKRCQRLLSDTSSELLACQKALKRCVQNINPEFAKSKYDFFVGLEGRPKVVCSVHYCPTTKKSIERRYADLTSLEAYPSSGSYPTRDEDGNLLETEFGLSIYQNHQTLILQEMPESAPVGQLPRSVEIMLDNDMVDAAQPGSRVQVVGQYRCLPGKKNGFTTAAFRTVLIANNIRPMSKESDLKFTDKDISMMRLISKRNDVSSLLSRSIAPSIYGHEQIKLAVLLLLLGGVERRLSNGSRIRGDINLLLMGDPSVAKSQFLRFVLYVAHRAIATTGRGSSGAGLTAAVTMDQESGERNLEAGAMVLADRGIVCIDEFDKMSDIDRTAIHEVMEQGRVTIAKAGIQAKLNARCSVVAAANPVYGKYDQYKTPMENIGLQDSLLSRFDLLFIVLDKADPHMDRSVAEHVLRIHRYRGPSEQDGEALPLHSEGQQLSTGPDPLASAGQEVAEGEDDGTQRQDEDQIYERQNDLLRPGRSRGNDQLTIKFLRKYIHVARQLKPQLTKEAASILAEKYCDFRDEEANENTGRAGPSAASRMRRTQPVTARSLETLIRLSSAHAKARMSKTVTKKDAEAAVQLVSFVLFKEVLEKRRKRGHADAETEGHSDDEHHPEPESTNRPAKRKAVQTPGTSTAPDDSTDPYAFSEDAGTENAAARRGATVELSADKMRNLSTVVSRLFQERRVEQLPLAELITAITGQSAGFTRAEVRAGLEAMHADNRIMLTADDVWLI